MLELADIIATFWSFGQTFILPLTVILVIFGFSYMPFFGKKPWDPKGKSCYVTGGSQGLGLSVAIQLAQKGADVTIVARNVEKLDNAIQELEKHRQSPNQIFRSHSASLNDPAGASGALEAEFEALGKRCPDAFFLCAGSSHPGYFVEYTEEQLREGMEQSYWVQAWTAYKATQMLVKHRQTGSKLVFVASTLSVMSIVGYSTYSPGKYALRGLAETLRSELLLYSTSVHLFLPPTMHSPGFETEMKTKPSITKKIEEDDTPLSCEEAARILLYGVTHHHDQISGNFITRLFRSSSRGSVPSSNPLFEWILDNVAWVAVPIWRLLTDRNIINERKSHIEYLEQRGFFKDAQHPASTSVTTKSNLN